MFVALLARLAGAQAPTAAPVVEITGAGSASYDVVVMVRYDGNYYYDDDLILLGDLKEALRARVAASAGSRVVIAADGRAPYDAVLAVLDAAKSAGALRTALLVEGAPTPNDDPLFPVDPEAVVALDEGLSKDQLQELKPRRHKFSQNPYANTTSYTAYTLEWGETKVGLGSITTGILPRIQLGTVPVLDFVGVPNLNLKANLMREGPLDGALLAQYYVAPLTSIIGIVDGFVDLGLASDVAGETSATTASYLGLGATGSLQLVDPWSIHLQLYWARPSARGEIYFDDLPEILFTGLSLGGEAEVALGVVGDLAVLNFATDVRFNRRDSVYGWLRYPFYGRVRGVTGGSIGGLEELGNVDLILAYGDFISIASAYSVAAGYQASYKHFEVRVGLGWSAVPATWILQAFELSYKFGGRTRKAEHEIRQGFDENRRELRDGGDRTPAEGGT